MKTLKEILDRYTDEQILNKLGSMYCDSIEELVPYGLALKEIRLINPRKSSFVISTKNGDVCGEEGVGKNNLGLEFTPWAIWLGSKIKTNSLKSLCYCLWEMTFIAYSEKEIKRAINRLNRIVKKITKKYEK